MRSLPRCVPWILPLLLCGCVATGRVGPAEVPEAEPVPREAPVSASALMERFLATVRSGDEAGARALLPALVSADRSWDGTYAAGVVDAPPGTTERHLLLVALLRRNAVPAHIPLAERIGACLRELARPGPGDAGSLMAMERLRSMGDDGIAGLRSLAAAGGERAALAAVLADRLTMARQLQADRP